MEYFSFFPGKTTVPVGTTLKFQITPLSYESHTATTGPGGPIDNPDQLPGASSRRRSSPSSSCRRASTRATRSGRWGPLTPHSHGNGFWNSGALDNVKASPQPTSNSVTFTAPGTYEFYCMVHPQMHGTVIVQ